MNLAIDHLTKSFGGNLVLDDISLSVRDVHSVVLIGPSGGGKSTLLRILAGLENPEAGHAEFDGVSVTCTQSWRRSVGVVFQAFNLFPHLTALENITLPLEKVHGVGRAEARDRAMEAMRRFQLEDHAGKKPAQLSGGQKQRIAIARALAGQPRLLLFDEPTSALDPEMTAEVLDAIRELKDDGRDIVLVTHQMGFARVIGDCVAYLSGGKILEQGAAETIFGNPQTEAAQTFLSRVLKY